MIGIALCLLIISWRSSSKEGFEDGDGDSGILVFTTAQCPFLSNQLKGAKESLAAAEAANLASTARTFGIMIESLEATMKKAGCTGKEEAAAVPLALPTIMTSADIAEATAAPPVIDLTKVPSSAAPSSAAPSSAAPSSASPSSVAPSSAAPSSASPRTSVP